MAKRKWDKGGLLNGPVVSTKVKPEDVEKILKKKGKAYGYLLWLDFAKKALHPQSGELIKTTKKKVKENNQALDQSLIEKARRSRIGQVGAFHLTNRDGTPAITTFSGIVVSKSPSVRGSVVTFRIDDKVFRGYIHKGRTLFEFKRVPTA